MSNRGIMACALVACALALPSQAMGQATPPTDPDAFRLDIAVGLKGGAAGSWALEVAEDVAIPFEDSTAEFRGDPEFYPMFGMGGDVGLSVDVRALGIIGIETGFRLSFDNGEGWNDKKLANSDRVIARIFQEQTTTSFRVPLLLKLSGNEGIVRPVLGLGAEFVFQTDSSIAYRGEDRAGSADGSLTVPRRRNKIETSAYTMVSAAFGLEVNVDQIRIPIEIRGGYNLGWSDSPGDRVRARFDESGNDELIYNGEFMGHFGVSIGVLYAFQTFM